MSNRRPVTSLETVPERAASAAECSPPSVGKLNRARSVSVDPSMWNNKKHSSSLPAKRQHHHLPPHHTEANGDDDLQSPSKRRARGGGGKAKPVAAPQRGNAIHKSDIQPAPPGVSPPSVVRPHPRRPMPSVLHTQGGSDSEESEECDAMDVGRQDKVTKVRKRDINSSYDAECSEQSDREGASSSASGHVAAAASPHSQLIETFGGFTVASPHTTESALGVRQASGGYLGEEDAPVPGVDGRKPTLPGGGRARGSGQSDKESKRKLFAASRAHLGLGLEEDEPHAKPTQAWVDGSPSQGAGVGVLCVDADSLGGVGDGGYQTRSKATSAGAKAASGGSAAEGGVSIASVTWNLAGKLPPASINSIVPSQPSDIYVIGTQECLVNCGTLKSFIKPSKAKWERRIQAVLGPSYHLVQSCSMNALHLAVFAQAHLIDQVTNLKVESVATGFMNLVGNKGGLAIKFSLQGKSFCFINSHLSAHQQKVESRNSDWRRIEDQLEKSLQSPSRRPKTTTLYTTHGVAGGGGGGKRSRRVADEFSAAVSDQSRREEGGGLAIADFVVWLGDLNYRIDMARREVVESIAENKVEELASRDQLRKAQTEGRVARGYHEGELSFKPTYKYDPASDDYDSSVKARVPAWTDRVLFKSRKGHDLKLVSYGACEDVKSSDHRPVMAYFETRS